MAEAQVQVTLAKGDAEALVPMVEEQVDAQAGTASGAIWRALHTAVVAALQRRA
jgi:hypothetical protein